MVGVEKREQIIGGISIDERPAVINEKLRLGGWEADTVIGRGHKCALRWPHENSLKH